jgi:uncharacterized protein (DUF1800 family)
MNPKEARMSQPSKPRQVRARRARGALMGLALLVTGAFGAQALDPTQPAATPAPDDEATVVHVLNRLAWGPRPGDVEAVRRLGVTRWIERQLHPESIPEPALKQRLAGLPTLALSSRELLARYDLSREAKRELRARRAELETASEQEQRRARRELTRRYAADKDGSPRQVLVELQAAKLMRAVHAERQLDELLVDFWMNHFNVYAQKGPVRFLAGPYERDVIRAHAWGRFEDLLLATAESPAMLFYLDNWLSADPQAAQQLLAQRQRRGSFGRRGGLERRGRPRGEPDTMRAGEDAPAPNPGQGRRRGLNENYARELMELHTLGVDGGYTQQDVTEVARCFTGWTIAGLRDGRPEFTFEARLHDRGDKRVLGHVLPSAGREEGRRVLHLLATHPSTARFISLKLARRFVADEPPPALVARAAETFSRTQGDVRAVLTTLLTAPEFLAPQTRAVKIKTPLDFVVSAVRATGSQIEDARDLVQRLADMGMPPYLQQPPTGYKDDAETWVSTSGLLARLNFALDLTAGRVRGLSPNPPPLLAGVGDARAAGRVLAARLVPQGLSESTSKTLATEGAQAAPERLVGLLLGSPEFQRR